MTFATSAAGAAVSDNTHESANRVTVHRMVDGTVADSHLRHVVHDLFESVQVLRRVAVQFHVADVPRIGERMVRSLERELLECRNLVVHRHMERVGVVVAVGHARNDAELFLVHTHEATGKTFGRCCKQAEVQTQALGFLVAEFTHVADNLEAQFLGGLGFAVVLAGKGHQGFGKADETDGKGAVLDDLAHGVFPAQLVGIDPHALSHEEGEVLDLAAALDGETFHELVAHQLQHAVQFLEEQVHGLHLDGDAGQVDRSETQIATAEADFAGRVVVVADHAGTATHVRDFRFRVTRLVILQVVRGILEAEVGEQALRAHLAGQLEQVVVGVARIQADAFLDAENLDGENGRLAAAQALVGGEQQVAHDHAGFGFGAHAVVDARKRRLGAGAAVHGVQVMNESFHGLEGGLVRLFVGLLLGELLGLHHHFGVIDLGKFAGFGFHEFFVGHEGRHHAHLGHFGVELLDHRHDFLFFLAGKENQGLHQVGEVGLAVGDAHAVGHGVVEVGNGLAAVLVILVTLYGNGGKSRVAADILGFAQVAMTGVETALEQFLQVDLAAGHGEGVEVQIVDVDIALGVCAAVLGLEHHHGVEMLGRFRAVLEHGAHGGVAVDVRVFALEVGFLGGTESNVAERVHEAGVHFADAGTLGTVQDVALGGISITALGQGLFNGVLNFFDFGLYLALSFQKANGTGRHLEGRARKHVVVSQQIQLVLGGLNLFVQFTRGAEGLLDSGRNLLDVKRHLAAVALFHCNNHYFYLFFIKMGQRSNNNKKHHILCFSIQDHHNMW